MKKPYTTTPLAEMSTEALRAERDKCNQYADDCRGSDDYSMVDFDRAMERRDEIARELQDRRAENHNRRPAHIRNALRSGGYAGDAPRRTSDHRIREIETSDGRRVPVNYSGEQWRYDNSPAPSQFRGWSESDCMTAFAEDFVAVVRGDRPRNAIMTTDLATMGIDPYIEPRIWNYIFQKSVLGKIGIGSINMPAEKHRVLIVKKANTPGWIAEGERISVVDNAIDGVEMHARKCGAILPMSRELLEDAANIGQTFVDHLSMSMANAIDDGMLSGNGVDGAPVGLLNKASILRRVQAGGTIYDEVVKTAYLFKQFDYPGDLSELALLWRPELGELAELAKDSQGRYLEPPDSFKQLKKVASTKILKYMEASDYKTDVTIVDPGSVIFGVRRSLRIEQSNSASYTDPETGETRNMFERDEAAWKFTFRGDIAVVREQFVRGATGFVIGTV